MTYYFRLGQLPHKRHTQFRQPDGSLYHEELMGIHGFAGAQSLVYHLRPPTEIQRMEAMQSAQIAYEQQGPLRHRHFRTIAAAAGGNAIEARLPMMGNSEVVLSIARPDKAMDYWYKHSAGDDVLFIHEGTGALETQFGTLHYRPGDYVVIPTGVMWRLLPERIHQPPPVHQTFDGPGFVVCSFVPRLFDYHPKAIPAPYNHSNVDSDEVLYYVEGAFMSRKGIERASITVHPNGIPHGPHPGTYEGSIGKKETHELAVMVDTFRPLQIAAAAQGMEDMGYPMSWLEGAEVR